MKSLFLGFGVSLLGLGLSAASFGQNALTVVSNGVDTYSTNNSGFSSIETVVAFNDQVLNSAPALANLLGGILTENANFNSNTGLTGGYSSTVSILSSGHELNLDFSTTSVSFLGSSAGISSYSSSGTWNYASGTGTYGGLGGSGTFAENFTIAPKIFTVKTTSFSGTLAAPVPEPYMYLLAGLGACIGFTRIRRTA